MMARTKEALGKMLDTTYVSRIQQSTHNEWKHPKNVEKKNVKGIRSEEARRVGVVTISLPYCCRLFKEREV